MKNKRGLTLVELIFIIVVAGILAVLATPGFLKLKESLQKNVQNAASLKSSEAAETKSQYYQVRICWKDAQGERIETIENVEWAYIDNSGAVIVVYQYEGRRRNKAIPLTQNVLWCDPMR
ncbi:prepilin-type N-terminal cleavage/methylation domain-containing protein [Candidatus Pacearchaeota archaeon]|nr:prepilin-type N-terminal cleavage/methylation domain-containing protein [Candidatus Pacearchaeota archaeon]